MTVRFESQAEPIPGYRLLERLGSGGFGEVWKAEAPGGIFKAIKIVFGDINSEDRDIVRFAEQELKALKRVKQVRHPYLLALDRYDIVEGRLLITMELADCNLWDRFREYRKRGQPGIPRPELLQYMAESAEVLDLMNDRFQLQHLDIKPQNLFLLYNHVKVADFGQVKDLEGMAAQVTGGITPVYAAPETFDGIISRFCDQYSLACVYQELLTGQRPFEGATMQQLLMQHLQMPPNLSPSPASDRPALARALAKKPEDRFPSCAALVAALREGTEATLRVGLPPAPPSAIADPVPRSGNLADPAVVSDRIEVRMDASGITVRPPSESRSESPPSSPSGPLPPPPPVSAPPVYVSPPATYSPPTSSGSGLYETANTWATEPPAEEEQSFDSVSPIAAAPPEENGPG
ncbi:MAG: serine/threonine protein kinase, partial [Bacteroidales bacterium]|nr:serine/threonine protein kinase [Bacteroidales bacterium]